MEKEAIIAGGAGGRGRVVSPHFSARGWVGCIVDLNRTGAAEVEALVRSHSAASRAFIADITDEGRVGSLMETTAGGYVYIGVPVNHAGITDEEHRRLVELPLESRESLISTNLTDTFLMLCEGVEVTVDRAYGNAINVAWLLAQRGTPYVVSTAVVESLMEYTAVELNPHGINVDATYPDMKVNTRFFNYLPPTERAKLAGPMTLNEVVYLLAGPAPGGLTGAPTRALEWRADSCPASFLAEKYLN